MSVFFGVVQRRTRVEGGHKVEVHVSEAQLDALYDGVSLGTVIKFKRADAKEIKAPHGDFAEAIRETEFFNNREVLACLGKESEYDDWIRGHEYSAVLSRRQAWPTDPIEAAHIRTVEDGSGTSYKNKYATIPMLRSEHRLAKRNQTSNGYVAVGGKEHCIKLRTQYRFNWGASKFFELFRLPLPWIPPAEIVKWCFENDLEKYLQPITEMEKESND